MTLLITPNPAQLIVPPAFDFTAEWQDESAISTPGSLGSPYVVDDANVSDEVGAETRLEGPIFTTPPDAIEKMVFESANPAVATVDSTGYVTSITDGSTTVRCRRRHVLREVSIAAAVDQVETVTLLNAYLSGTVGKHIKDEATALLAASTQTNIYSSGTTRNANVWTGDYNLTGVAYSNTTSGNAQRGGTLISPRHIIFVDHYKIAVGATITFVTANGTEVTRTLSARQTISPAGSTPTTNRDVTIGLLSSDVPGTLTWYKLMPADWQDYLTLYGNSNVPVVALDQQRNALQRWRKIYPYPASDPALRAIYNSVFVYHHLASSASQEIVVGDSGQPIFHPIDGELVLLGCHTWETSAFLLGMVKTEIDAAMTSLGGGYTSTAADLTGFNNYG